MPHRLKIVVEHKKVYGKDMFYAADDWTMEFMNIFKTSIPRKAFSLDQIKKLKELGFNIEIKYPTPEF